MLYDLSNITSADRFFYSSFFGIYQGPCFYHPQSCWSKHYLKLCTFSSQGAPTLQVETHHIQHSSQEISCAALMENNLLHKNQMEIHTYILGTTTHLHFKSLYVNCSMFPIWELRHHELHHLPPHSLHYLRGKNLIPRLTCLIFHLLKTSKLMN